MNWKSVWDALQRPKVAIPCATIASLLIIIDSITHKIGFVLPVIQFVWKIIQLHVPVSIILFLALVIFIAIKLKSQKLTEKDVFIISFLDKGLRGLKLLCRAYKTKFPEESRTMSSCVTTLKRLERKKLVHCESLSGGAQEVQDEEFKLTKKGLKRYKALDSVLKEKAGRIFDELAESTGRRKPEKRKEERIESHDEIMFILYLLANQPDKYLDKAVLGSSYFEKFSQKGTTDFHIMWDRLEKSGFIDQCHDQTGYGVTNDFSITSRGLDYYANYKESK